MAEEPARRAENSPQDAKDSLIPTVKHTIAVSSGKGGVGK
jgi:Mrp family chromosome partitioning ATPase